MRHSFKSVGLPVCVIRLESGQPFVLGAASPDGQRFRFLPLFDIQETAEAFRAVATVGKEYVATISTWGELLEVVQAALSVGCDRVAWNPGELHMKEQVHMGIAELLHTAQSEKRLDCSPSPRRAGVSTSAARDARPDSWRRQSSGQDSDSRGI